MTRRVCSASRSSTPMGSRPGSAAVRFDEGEPATAILDGTFPGSYKIIVGSAEPDTDITATIQPVDVAASPRERARHRCGAGGFRCRRGRGSDRSPSRPNPRPPTAPRRDCPGRRRERHGFRGQFAVGRRAGHGQPRRWPSGSAIGSSSTTAGAPDRRHRDAATRRIRTAHPRQRAGHRRRPDDLRHRPCRRRASPGHPDSSRATTSLSMTISSPGSDAPSFVYSPVLVSRWSRCSPARAPIRSRSRRSEGATDRSPSKPPTWARVRKGPERHGDRSRRGVVAR